MSQFVVDPDPTIMDLPTYASPVEPVRHGSGLARFLIVVVSLALVAGVGALIAYRTLVPASGAESPEAAFQGLFQAADDEDLLQLVMLIAPEERDAVIEPMRSVFAEAERLAKAEADADSDAAVEPLGLSELLDAVDISVEGLTFTAETLDPAMVYVTTTGGTMHLSIDLDALGDTGDLLSDEIGAAPTEATIDLGAEPVSFAIVERDGRWYLSLMYSVAEGMRSSVGADFPGLGNGPAPVGGATPEEAVEQFATEMFDGDLLGVMTTFDPVELGVLYDYAPLFSGALEEARAGYHRGEFLDATFELTDLELSSQERDGRTTVTVSSFGFVETDAYTGAVSTFSMSGDCFTSIDDEGTKVDDCLEGLGNASLTVVERDGRWYVSVIATMIHQLGDHLSTLDRFPDDAVASFVDGVRANLNGESLSGAEAEFVEIEPPVPPLVVVWRVVAPIPAGTPSAILESAGYIQAMRPAIDTPNLPVDAIGDFGSVFGLATSVEVPQGEMLAATHFQAADGGWLVVHYEVVRDIPVGTPAGELSAGGYVEPFAVPMDQSDEMTVWDVEAELIDMMAIRPITIGEILTFDAFG